MEINSYLQNYIQIYDNFIAEDQLKILTKVCKDRKEFEEGKIVDSNTSPSKLNKKIRDVKIWNLEHIKTNNFTQIFWTNFFGYTFKRAVQKYAKNFDMNNWFNIVDIQILKYTPGCHYSFHYDDSASTPRSISCIFFINDDYEGGNLMFRFPNVKESINIEKVKNRMIVWPSNFLYPHCVSPVTKGERYSVVSWVR